MKKLITLGIALGLIYNNSLAQSAWSWGYNLQGNLGNGTWGTGFPTNTPGPTKDTATNYVQLSTSGGGSSLGVKADGSLWGWGNNYSGELAGYVDDQIVPVHIGTDNDWAFVSTGEYHVAGLKKDGSIWTWGDNSFGTLGNGATGGHDYVPKQMGTDKNWAALAAGVWYTVAIKTDGSMWYWGSNYIITPAGGGATPTQIGTAKDWKSVATGVNQSGSNTHTVAIKTDGTLWALGFNAEGELGQGSTGKPVGNFVQVGTDKDWVSASAGGSFTLARKADGSLWAWGLNSNGQLGDGTTSNKNIPTQVGTDKDWKFAETGFQHSLAIKNDGTLWTWGWNMDGELGLGHNKDVSKPTKVGTGNNWLFADGADFFTVAIRKVAPTSIANSRIDDKTIHVFPNPFTNTINLNNIKPDQTCTLINALGQMVWQGTNIAQQDFSATPKGVYFLKINTDDGEQMLKLIKE